LGSWRQPELQQLNSDSFKKAIDICLDEKVNFVLIAGDLFDSAYPSIEILELAFIQLKRLKDAKISCYYIAGSHDYSASGKTFLSVLESAGFCKNIYSPEEKNSHIYLNPILHENIALYGYPGKKSGMEVQELRRVKLHESPGLFRLYALHTCIKGALGNLPVDSLLESELPEADYYALGHLHIDYQDNNIVYAGPIFPDNFQELEELKFGSLYIVETNPKTIRKVWLKIKEIESLDLEISNALTATDKIISELGKKDVKDKIILLRISGTLVQGKTSDIDFKKIEEFVKSLGAYSLLKSTSQLSVQETEVKIEVENMDKLEEEIIAKYASQEKSNFEPFILPLVNSLSIEKQEDETSTTFNSRLFSEINKLLEVEI
jgi:DNA repair exonuclease SbcCD nuclease subunit